MDKYCKCFRVFPYVSKCLQKSHIVIASQPSADVAICNLLTAKEISLPRSLSCCMTGFLAVTGTSIMQSFQKEKEGGKFTTSSLHKWCSQG